MGDMLSQEEINALLRGLDIGDDEPETVLVTDEEKDAIGEVSNISMGTAATTLFSLVNQKVMITTPRVSIVKWNDIVEQYKNPCVAIQIVYKEGLKGTNLLILQENDVRIIADLMMGGDGLNPDPELNDLHLSAIGEAMNQMIGSAATSMSAMFKKKIDIQPPVSSHIDLNEPFDPMEIDEFLKDDFIKVSFSLQIGDLVDSEMMQLYPITFAKDIYNEFMNTQDEVVPAPKVNTPVKEEPKSTRDPIMNAPTQNNMGMGNMDMNNMGMNNMGMNNMGMNNMGMNNMGMGNMGINNMDMNNMGMNNMGMNNMGMNNMGMNNMGMNNMGMNNMGMNNMGMGNMGMNNMGMSGMMPTRNIEVQQAQFQQFDMNSVMQQKENIDLIMDVKLEVSVELGRTFKTIKDVLEFAPGTIIELNKLSGEPIDVLVNGKIVAKGEVVVIDENFSIRVTDIVKQQGQL